MPGGVGEYQALNKKGRTDVKAPESVMAVESSWRSSWHTHCSPSAFWGAPKGCRQTKNYLLT